MKDFGHYTFEIERAGMKVKISAGGLVALLSMVAFAVLIAAYLFR